MVVALQSLKANPYTPKPQYAKHNFRPVKGNKLYIKKR